MSLKKDQADFEHLATLFRAAGGVIENLRLGQGSRGRGLFVVDPELEAHLHVSPQLLLPVEDIELFENRPRIRPGAEVPDAARAFYEAYYASIGFPENTMRDAKRAMTAQHRLPDAVQEVMLKGNPDGLTRYPAFHHNRVLDWHVGQRCLLLESGQRVVIPMMELANHDSRHAAFDMIEGGLSAGGRFEDEFLVRYNAADCWTTYLSWGFVAPSDRVVSLGMPVTEPGGWRVRILADGRARDTQGFSEVSAQDGVLTVSRLMLVGPDGVAQARAFFRSQIAPYGVENADELFSVITNANVNWYENLLRVAKSSARNPALAALRQAAKMQLTAIRSGAV